MKNYPSIKRRFCQLDNFLQECRCLWQSRPFFGLPVQWEQMYPEVAEFLRSLTWRDIEDGQLCYKPDIPPMLEYWHRQSLLLTEVGAVADQLIEARELSREMPKIAARKWQQIRYFCGAMMSLWPSGVERIVDWCSGKGHLGRTLGMLCELPVTFFEYQPDLCMEGQTLARDCGVRARFVCADVLQSELRQHIEPQGAIVALHACGQLHTTLLQNSANWSARAIAVSPCCYHNGIDASYTALSKIAQSSEIQLDSYHLRLAATNENVAPERQKRQRRQEMAWRLGFDLLLREATGDDVYHPIPSFPRRWLRCTFREFCTTLARHTGFPLPMKWNPQTVEQSAWQRLRLVLALGLVPRLFRRPLELWLVLDRAMYLIEQGADVRVGVFCPFSITPRNLLIFARFG